MFSLEMRGIVSFIDFSFALAGKHIYVLSIGCMKMLECFPLYCILFTIEGVMGYNII